MARYTMEQMTIDGEEQAHAAPGGHMVVENAGQVPLGLISRNHVHRDVESVGEHGQGGDNPEPAKQLHW